jgi:hypothetical protein
MKCIASGAASAILLTGCLNVPPEPIAQIPAPVCTTQAQCDSMWAAAQQWVSRVSRMQVAQVSPDAIVTYPRVESDRTTMTGTVVKRPLQDGKYEFSVRFECWDPQSSCARLEQSGVSLFNTMVTAAGEGPGG